MKTRVFNLVVLLIGASVFLTAHYYQSDTDQVSVKQTMFPGKDGYRYVPDYPVYKRPGYSNGTNYSYHDLKYYTTDSSTLSDKRVIVVYEVANKTKDYLVVPISITFEENESSAADPSYTVVGAVTTKKFNQVDYYIMDPKETMKGMMEFLAPPISINIEPQAATVVDKKWVQGLQQALNGDKKKLGEYLADDKAVSARFKLKEKLTEISQPDFINNIAVKFVSSHLRKNYGDSIQARVYDFEVTNNNPYDLIVQLTAPCFSSSGEFATVSANQKSIKSIGVYSKVVCDTTSFNVKVGKASIK